MPSPWAQALTIADESSSGTSVVASSLLEFIPAVSPQYAAPSHLGPIVEALEQAILAAEGNAEPVFACTSVPPQHAKTETLLHAIAYWLKRRPQDLLAYLSYNSEIAEQKSRKARDYARLSGIELRDDTHSVKTWRTLKNGGLIARGLTGGAITGMEGLQLAVVDDPFKNRAEAESRTIRERAWQEFRDSLWSRLHKNTSVIVNATRWHTDDLHGRIGKDPELSKLFRFVNLPAIREDGSALWPEVMPLDLLEKKRAGSSEYTWWSLYMGEPRPREGKLFDGVHWYRDLPGNCRYAIGYDLAYSSKTSSDWSIAVVMAESGGRFYVVDVVRRQCAAPDFGRELKTLSQRYPGAPLFAYLGGTEKGTADFLQREGVPVTYETATADKFVRAQPFSAAWNNGQVMMPEGRVLEGSPLKAFLDCLLDFTGLNDPHDDDVDAAAAAFDRLAQGGIYVPKSGKPKPNRVAGRARKQALW